MVFNLLSKWWTESPTNLLSKWWTESPESPESPTKQLRRACETGNIAKVRIAIERGANYLNGGLYDACEGGYTDIVNLLIQRGATRWDEGLEFAIKGGHIDIVRLIIEKGVHADYLRWDITTACEYGTIDIVKLLFEKGATADWDNCFDGACRGGQIDIVKLLIEKHNYGDNGPWHRGLQLTSTEGYVNCNKNIYGSCCRGYIDVAKLMIENGATDWAWTVIGTYARRLQLEEPLCVCVCLIVFLPQHCVCLFSVCVRVSVCV